MNNRLIYLITVIVLSSCLNTTTGIDDQAASGGGSLAQAAVDGQPLLVDGWTLVSIDMGVLWLDIQPDEQEQVDLAGVGLLVQLELEGEELVAHGTVSQGVFLDGVVDLSGSLKLVRPWLYSGQGYHASLASGAVSVNITQSSLAHASFSGEVTVDMDMGSPEGDDLKLNGSISKGSYTPGKGVDFGGELTLVSPFTYEKNKLTVHLKSGSVGVEVKKSEFKKAVLDVDANVDIENAESSLNLGGSINGKINEDYDIDFSGSVTVERDFTRSFERVTATLKDGGQVGVKVEKSEFQWAMLENITVEIRIDVGGKDLKLNGEVSKGKYDDNGIDLKASLGLLEVFTYDKDPVSVTLTPDGDVGVTVKDNELKKATLNGLTCTVTVMDSDGTQQTVTGVLDKGVYWDDTIRLRSDDFKEAGLTRIIVVRIDDDDEEEDEKPVDGTGN